MEDKTPFKNLSKDTQRLWEDKARLLIERGYPVPEKDIYVLAEIMYNKTNK